MKAKSAARRIALVLLPLCAAGLLWQDARSEVRAVSAPPPQLTAGETIRVDFFATCSGDIGAVSSDPAVADIQVAMVSAGVISCTVTAQTDGVAVLSCTVGGRQSPAYAVSVVPPAPTPLTSGAFLASKGGKKFHRADCVWAGKIQAENRVFFEDAPDARAKGYTPCAQCLKS